MTRTTDPVALDDWQAIGRSEDISRTAPRRTRLLGQDLLAERDAGGTVSVWELGGDGAERRACPVQERYGHVWTTLGDPARDLFAVPEFEEEGRRLVTCGIVTVRTSPLRIVENFLDLAHFPFVHTDVLGAEPLTEVEDYRVEVREAGNEVWLLDCRFYQQQASRVASGGQMTEYLYRVPSPFVPLLYKTSPGREGAFDVIGLFIQPREETVCDVHSFVLVFDAVSTDVELLHFQQMIFLQDRSIIENQIPKRLPLDPGRELPTRADAGSIAYRRWLRARGLRFGAAP